MKRISFIAISGVLMFSASAALAAYDFTGPTQGPTGGNTPGVIWNMQSGIQSNAKINIDGDAWIGKDFYLKSGKSIRVDALGSTSATFGNWGNGAQPFTLYVNGDIKSIGWGTYGAGQSGTMYANQFCFHNGNCVNTSWPSGGGGGTISSISVGSGLTVTNPTGPTATIGLSSSCAAGQILKWNGASWACAADTDTNSGGTLTGITAGTGATISGGAPSPTINVTDLYVNTSGDTMSGALTLLNPGGLYNYGGYYGEQSFKYTDVFGSLQSAGWMNPGNHAFLEMKTSSNSLNIDFMNNLGIGINSVVDAAYWPNTSGASFTQKNSTLSKSDQISFDIVDTNMASAGFANQYPDDYPTAHVGGYIGYYSGSDYRGIDVVANNPGGSPAIGGYFTHTAGQSARLASASYALDTTGVVNFSGTGNVTVAAGKNLCLGTSCIAAWPAPAGSDYQFQYKSGNNFVGDSQLYWDNSNKVLVAGTPNASLPQVARLQSTSPNATMPAISAGNSSNLDNVRMVYTYGGVGYGVNSDVDSTDWGFYTDGKTHSTGNIDTNGYFITSGGLISFDGTPDQTAMMQLYGNDMFLNLGANNTLYIRASGGTGTTNQPFKLQSGGDIHAYGSGSGYYFRDRSLTTKEWAMFSQGDYAYFYYSPDGASWSNKMQLSNTGNLWIAGAYSSSDERLKDLHGDYSKGLDAIMRINPYSYTFKQNNPLGLASDESRIGPTAQEIKKLIPEAVKTDDKGYLMMTLDPIVWTSVNAIKELKAENDKLKTQNESLEWRLRVLEAKMDALMK